MTTTALTESPAFLRLKVAILDLPHLSELITPARIQSHWVQNGPLQFSYAASWVNEPILDHLQNLVMERNVLEGYERILAGEVMNVGEGRSVRHHQPRSSQRGFYGEEQSRFGEFAEAVRSGEIRGCRGDRILAVVQIGIGGSDLGPRALYVALDRTRKDGDLTVAFIANVDPDDAIGVLRTTRFAETLFIVVSKSGTTQETLANQNLVRQWALAQGFSAADFAQHSIAVTGKGSPMDTPEHYRKSFYIDDAIGGRFSSTSAVGGVVLSLAFGAAAFESLLQGAGAMDEAARSTDIRSNMSLLSAAIGVLERNIFHCTSKAVIPYSEALSRFPAHLQQMDCESNGKSVSGDNSALNYRTGPVIFGEPGTNGQHSFFQLLHQGTDIIPVQFIGFRRPQMDGDTAFQGSTNQTKLMANLVAQITALAIGQPNDNPNKRFPGNRPSSLVLADRLDAHSLGALLAFFENLVMFQGLIWGVNSFDQEGVQLGKRLADTLLKTPDADPLLAALMAQLKTTG